MKKLLLLFLITACTEEIVPTTLVEVYKIDKQFYHCAYYIYAVPPQLPLSDSVIVDKCGKYKVGDRFYINSF